MLYKIGVISLGCDKNRVDTEKMLYKVKEYGHTITDDILKADIIIVNTCAFLNSSREESVNEVINAKKNSGGKPIIMTGCMPQKFVNELYENFTEVCAFLGTNDYDRINEAISCAANGIRFNGVNSSKSLSFNKGRVISTPKHYAYLMIADGCDNRCTYCLIPYIRGKYRSSAIEDIVAEADLLVKGGVKELILVAQDVTRYGKDLYGSYSIVKLIKGLSQIEGLFGIRLLYCYPELVTDELIEEIKNNDKVIKYIDIPLQHISDKILKLMGRRTDSQKIKQLIHKLRNEIGGISIRSTFIVGFPGEEQADFEELCGFLKEYKIDNAGFFAYSREKGTPSYSFNNQVNYNTKQKRLKTVNLIQQSNYLQKNRESVNSVLQVICDGYNQEKGMYAGRTAGNAPSVDRCVYFSSDRQISGGELINVAIDSCDVYDLYGRETT